MTAPDPHTAPPPHRPGRPAALAANLLLPGVGQWMRGRRVVGAMIAVSFVGSLVVAAGAFVVGYYRYLSLALSGDLFAAGRLEGLASCFHWPLVIGGVVVALVVFAVAQFGLLRADRPPPPDGGSPGESPADGGGDSPPRGRT